jgi:hypothetical protein
LCGACTAGSALAQSTTPAQGLLTDSWVFNLGGFVVNSDLTANLNGQFSQNPEVDFDETFDRGNDATRVRGDVLWRITPTHHLRLMYFNNSNERSKVLAAPIKWGDYTFQAGSNVNFKHEMEVIELAYEYAFMRQPTYEVSASLGVHYTDTTIQLDGTAIITNPDGTTRTESRATKNSSVAAPLPVIGLRGAWAVAPQWVLDAQVQYFGLSYDEYDGSWSDVRLGATWMFSRNFGVGLGYNYFSSKVDVEKASFNGRLKTSYSGLQAYLTGSF